MKVSVTHKKNYGRHLFYASDEWTMKFFKMFKSPQPQVSVSQNQLEILKELGFEIEIDEHTEPVKI